jgi:hypothetical protein
VSFKTKSIYKGVLGRWFMVGYSKSPISKSIIILLEVNWTRTLNFQWSLIYLVSQSSGRWEQLWIMKIEWKKWSLFQRLGRYIRLNVKKFRRIPPKIWTACQQWNWIFQNICRKGRRDLFTVKMVIFLTLWQIILTFNSNSRGTPLSRVSVKNNLKRYLWFLTVMVNRWLIIMKATNEATIGVSVS